MQRSAALLYAIPLLLAGCNSPDAVKNAQQVNETKADRATASTESGEVRQEGLNYDSEFMTKAASGGLLEVQLGQQVAARALTPEARKYAGQMVSDHTKANAELTALAARKNITLPTALGDDHASVLKDVTEEKGVKLDQEYLKEMQKDHEEDVEEYTEASIKAADPEIKAFAAKNIPILKMHLDMVTKLRPAVDARK